jgi:hypothetical protein
MPPRLNCFVAMAFAREDCNEIYDKYILPILKELRINPIRVDRREHRDDLNNFIIRMLRSSNFAIVDLTYARPSVYYEAGFAERSIPVVYTSRADHLSKAQPDDRLRVHFDLEMKKIVSWNNVKDNTFPRRLRQRINYIIRPLLRDRSHEETFIREREAFQSLSTFDKLNSIRKVFISKLRSAHFSVCQLSDIRPTESYLAGGGVLVGFKKVGTQCFTCFVIAGSSITRRQIEFLINSTNGLIHGSKDEINKYTDFYCFCSPRGIPESRLTSAFPRAKPLGNKGLFGIEYSVVGYQKSRHVRVYLMPNIDSKIRIFDLARMLGESLDKRKGYRVRKKPAPNRWNGISIVFQNQESGSTRRTKTQSVVRRR